MVLQVSGFFSNFFRRSYPAFFLACFWSTGLLFGLEMYRFSGISSSTAICQWNESAAPEDLIIRVLVPFLLCLIGVLLDQRWLIYGCAFGKAFLFSFVSLCMMGTFGSGGWLVRILLLFTDTLMCAIWYIFWQDCLRPTQPPLAKSIFLCAAGLFLAGLDVRMISPLVMRLLNS